MNKQQQLGLTKSGYGKSHGGRGQLEMVSGVDGMASFYFDGRLSPEVTCGGKKLFTCGTDRSENERERRGKGGSIING